MRTFLRQRIKEKQSRHIKPLTKIQDQEETPLGDLNDKKGIKINKIKPITDEKSRTPDPFGKNTKDTYSSRSVMVTQDETTNMQLYTQESPLKFDDYDYNTLEPYDPKQ